MKCLLFKLILLKFVLKTQSIFESTLILPTSRCRESFFIFRLDSSPRVISRVHYFIVSKKKGHPLKLVSVAIYRTLFSYKLFTQFLSSKDLQHSSFLTHLNFPSLCKCWNYKKFSLVLMKKFTCKYLQVLARNFAKKEVSSCRDIDIKLTLFAL